jgi:hypothetical protein
MQNQNNVKTDQNALLPEIKLLLLELSPVEMDEIWITLSHFQKAEAIAKAIYDLYPNLPIEAFRAMRTVL